MTDDPDQDLRAAYAARPDAPGHPDEEAWVRLATGEMPRSEREAVVDHVERCGECARVYRGLKMLAADARSIDPSVPALEALPTPAVRPFWWAGGALAAAAAAVLFVLFRPPTAPVMVDPAPAATSDLRSGAGRAPVPLHPVGRVGVRPARFQWQAVAEARAYRVSLLDRQGEVAWTSPEVTMTSVELPASVPLAPGRHYWQVVALPASGGEPIPSPIIDFEI